MPASSLFTKRFLGKGSSPSAQPHPLGSSKSFAKNPSYAGNIHPSGKDLGALTTHTYIVLQDAGFQNARKRFPDQFSRGCALHIHFPKNRFLIPLQTVSVWLTHGFNPGKVPA
jgi:hypothetical protein